MNIHFPKLYKYDRLQEHCSVAIPFAKGEFTDADRIAVLEDGVEMPVQSKVTARYADGSVRYLFVRFQADLPANQKKDLQAELIKQGAQENMPHSSFQSRRSLVLFFGSLRLFSSSSGTEPSFFSKAVRITCVRLFVAFTLWR